VSKFVSKLACLDGETVGSVRDWAVSLGSASANRFTSGNVQLGGSLGAALWNPNRRRQPEGLRRPESGESYRANV
jgi:hypothetical protein